MKYVVVDIRKDGTGNVWNTEHNTLKEAVDAAKRKLFYMSYSERKVRNVFVIESANPDEEAENHLDGDVVWEAK